MTNEEKVLDLLTQINGRLDGMDSRMERMEGRMDRMESMQLDMQSALTKVALTQENVVLPQLKLLAEGHETLLETLAPKGRVEKLEEEIDLLKTVVRALSKDVAELRRAQ